MRELAVVQGSQDWLDERAKRISASDIGAMLGLDEYQPPTELYYRKRGEIGPLEETLPMRMGKMLEPVVVRVYCEDFGIDMNQVRYPCPAFVADDERWIATPDVIYTPNKRELIEAKATTSYSPMWKQATKGDLPDYIFCQAQWQMFVVGIEICHVAILCDGRNLRTFDVERDDGVIDSIVIAADEFWHRIKNGDPPEWDASHPSYSDSVKRVYTEISGERLPLSKDAIAKWNKREHLMKEIAALESEAEILKSEVLAEIGNAECGILSDGRMIKRSRVEGTQISYFRKPYLMAKAVKDPLAKRSA